MCRYKHDNGVLQDGTVIRENVKVRLVAHVRNEDEEEEDALVVAVRGQLGEGCEWVTSQGEPVKGDTRQ
jgi:inorganic pyrophosphatase